MILLTFEYSLNFLPCSSAWLQRPQILSVATFITAFDRYVIAQLSDKSYQPRIQASPSVCFLLSNLDCFLWPLLKLEIALVGTFELL